MPLQFSYNHSLVQEKDIQNYLDVLAPLREKIQKTAQATDYSEPLSFVHLPYDITYHDQILQVVHEKQQLKPSLIFLIGIGGSNLGTLAIHQALQGTYYNDLKKTPQFFCADTVDAEKNKALAQLIEQELKQQNKVLFIIVSKSGTTLETQLNADFFIEILKKYYPENYAEQIVAITDKNSPLWQQAQQNNYAALEIPKEIGGRFSVFSAVGLFPLALLGIDIQQLLLGAQKAIANDHIAAERAAILFHHYQAGLSVHDLFILQTSYQAVGIWYRQLMAESLGKQGKGMLPTVSTAVDLHSQIQLYLGGPRCRITTFIAVENQSPFQQKLAQAIPTTYHKEKLPFMTFSLKNDSFSLGYLLQSMMLEIVYLGQLMEVPVFDQPQVELYKQEMRALAE